MAAHPPGVDDRDPGPVHGDCLAFGMQLHPGGGLSGILDNPDVTFVGALGKKGDINIVCELQNMS